MENGVGEVAISDALAAGRGMVYAPKRIITALSSEW
jgi:hypothetical protein